MSASYKPVPTKPFLKGMNACTDPYTIPPGTFPRGSNLLLNKRGALDVCDGTQLVHAFNGAVQAGRGKVMGNFLFMPTGVPSYYLSLIKALDIPLGFPLNLVLSDGGTGGGITGNIFYKVTAIDGTGGETIGSQEATINVAANHKVILTWNVVPNATGYNIYRAPTTGAEILITAANLPVPQVPSGTLSVTYTDDGLSTSTVSLTLTSGAPFGSTVTLDGLSVIWNTTTKHNFIPGYRIAATNSGDNRFNGNYTVGSILSATSFITANPNNVPKFTAAGPGSITAPALAPAADSTQQTALFQMPVIPGSIAKLPVSYNNSNIVALFPADPLILGLSYEGGGGGGAGGGGGPVGGAGSGAGGSSGGGGGASGSGASPTPSGGIPGNISTIPLMVEFTNRVVLALGNGFPPQLFSDATGTLTNPATIAAISAISVDAFGVVTVTTATPHGLVAAQVGANVVIAGVTNALYNMVGPTISIVSATQYKVRNISAIAQAASSGGTSTTTTVPITNSFVPAFPVWSATTQFNQNSVVVPTISNGFYYVAVQGGVTGASQPVFPTGTGSEVGDGSVLWRLAGPINTAAPSPPGCAHVTVYAGSVWMLNTSPTNTASGIDGPCSLRMSDVNNPLSWNPINQAFLDKDDGTEGTGLASFTITAQGIPPEGSLVVFKNYVCYQIVGIFGSPTLTIQKIKSDMGCVAPRSIQFVPGFGITRFSHLGFSVFDGVEDRVTSEDIRPFLFATNDFSEQDITVLDSNFQAAMWGFQTANPPMYCAAIPIGNSSGKLTRILCYDLVLKAWTAPVDLPFPVSTGAQFRTVVANPVTILGGFSDGLLSRWQAGDQMWDVGASGARIASVVLYSVKLPEAASQTADQKLNCRRVAIRGIATNSSGQITVTPVVNGTNKPSQSYNIPLSGDFEVFASFMRDGLRFSAIISGSGQLEFNRFSFHITAKEVGAKALVS